LDAHPCLGCRSLTKAQIGGSIGGLMCGTMLKHQGYDVTILEREVNSSRQGYDAGIKVGPEVTAFLEKHDRVKRDMIITCQPGITKSTNGESKPQRGQTFYTCSWGLISSVLRANFDGFTSVVVPVAPEDLPTDGKATFLSGAQVNGINEVDGKMQVQYVNVTSGSTETITAGIAIVADGTASGMRRMLCPDVKREYQGYMCWRGTVREDKIASLDEEINKQYLEKATFHLMNQNYLINYTIPTDAGDIEQGKRLHNWLWYSKMPEGSPEMDELFTDVNGVSHHGTVPRGLIRPEKWEAQKALAQRVLPAGLATIVQNSRAPFVTKIYDVMTNKATFFDGKVFMIGDAQVTIRPNVGMGTTHAANDILELEKVIEGTATAEQWEKTCLAWDAAQRRFAMAVTSYGLDSTPSLIWNGLAYFGLLAGQKIGVF
jgi:2-polyprenyl-6-methoxyphenol hydroxylase-like FAD-dependent oxidoreductase